MPPTSDGRDGQQNASQNQEGSNNNRRNNRRRNHRRRKNKRSSGTGKVEVPKNPIEGINKKYYFQFSNKPGAEPFAAVARSVIDHFAQKHLDMAYVFKKGYKKFELDPQDAEPVQSTYGSDVSEFNKAHRQWKQDKEKRNNAEAALCSMIECQCTPSVLTRLRSKSTYESIDSSCDSMDLLKLVRDVCAEQADTKPQELSMVESDKNVINFRQGKLTNQDYYDYFMHRANFAIAAKCALGASIEAVQAIYDESGITAPTAEQRKAAITEARELYLATLFITNSAERYDQLRRDLQNQKAMNPGGDSPYPVTVRAALELLNDYRTTKVKTSKKSEDREGVSFHQRGDRHSETNPDHRRQPGRGRGGRTSGRGRGSGGRQGRGRSAPTDSNDPADATGAHAHHQQAEDGTHDSDDYYSDNNYSDEDSVYSVSHDEDVFDTELTFLHSNVPVPHRRRPLPSYVRQRSRKTLPKSWVLLDSASTASIFSNAQLLHGIHDVDDHLIVRCNAGTIRLTQQGYFGSYPVPIWFNPSGIANILSKFEVARHYEVSYHNKVSADYIITTGSGIIRFTPTSSGLYYKDFGRAHRHAWAFFETVKGQKSKFTKKDVRRAARARQVQNIIGRPGFRQFKDIIAKHFLPQTDVEVRDIDIADTIYGPNLGSLKGKTPATTNTPVRTPHMDLPPHVKAHHSDVTLAVDIMFINKVPFLVTISRDLKFGTVEQLMNRQVPTVVAMLQDVFALYERPGLHIRTILADLEFEPLKADFPGVTIDCCAVDTMYPSFPALDGVSAHESPRELVTGHGITAKRHVRTEFGAYVQTHEEHDNSMRSRTVGAICLGPTGSSQGAHYFMNLATGNRIVRQHWTEMPMPDDVIKHVTALGAAQGMPTTLTFADRHGKELLDDDDDEDDDHDSNYDSDDASSQSSSGDSGSYASSSSSDSDDDDDHPAAASDADSTTASVEYVATRRLLQPATAGVNDSHTGNNGNGPNTSRPSAARILRFAPPTTPPARDSLAATTATRENAGVNTENAGVTTGNTGVATENTGVDTENAGVDPPVDTENAGVDPPPTGSPQDDPDASFNARLDATTNELAQDIEEGNQLLDSAHTSAERGEETEQTALDAEMDEKYGPRNHNHGLRKRKAPDFSHLHTMFHVQVSLLTEQMSAKRGLKVFGQKGADAIVAEMHQLHYRRVIKPVVGNELTRDEKKAALKYLMFLKQKRCGKIKARGCADGRKQRLWKTKEETSAPTVRTESCFISAVIDAMERRSVLTIDIPGAFMQADIDELVHVKFEGELAELLVKVDPRSYRKYVCKERGKKVIYVELEKALYGTLQGALLFWKNLSSFLTTELGFELNPYDNCVANKEINGSQCTILWHVDDLKMSHKDAKVLEHIAEQLNTRYGKEAPLTINRGKVHDYLGMTIDYSMPGKVQFRMRDYIERLLAEALAEAPEDMKGIAATPAAIHLFKINNKNPKLLDNKQADFFHHMVAKLLYLCKRVRPDIMTAVAFLTTRVSKPDADDYAKLCRCIKYLRGTKDLDLTLEADGSGCLQWWVDASFAVHMDMKSHTGAMLTLGKGGVVNISTKQKIMTDSSTTGELVAVHDVLPLAVWARKFLEAQGYSVSDNIIYQDNQSAILLEENGRKSCGRRTRHLDIRYFYATDLVERGEIRIEFCPTAQMLGDFFTKPLQGLHFRRMRALILNLQQSDPMLDGSQECVGTARRI